MSFKRYIFKSGLDIIAPLKCGTRWLDGLDLENRIDTFAFSIDEIEENIYSGTTFIWRPVKEHLMSAIQTDWALSPDIQIWDIINKAEQNTGSHWYPRLYEKLYPLWLKFGFKFYNLRALSELTPSASKHKWASNQFNFTLPIEHTTVKEALSSLSLEQTIKIQKLIDDEDRWLKLMIKSQYTKNNWEDFLDLEEKNLKMKCKVVDLEDKVVGLEGELVSLEDTVLKLKGHNIYLEGEIIKLKDKLAIWVKWAKSNKKLI